MGVDVTPSRALQSTIAAIGTSALPNRTQAFQHAVAGRLVVAGWSVQLEVPQPTGTRNGRIDIVAERNGARVAIECDRQSPRRKSICKLLAHACDARLVLLRGDDEPMRVVDGVAVLGLPVHGPPECGRPRGSMATGRGQLCTRLNSGGDSYV